MTTSRRRFTQSLFAVASLLTGMPVLSSEGRATTEEAKAMLAKALAHIKAAGRDKAFSDFMAKPGPWIDRDLYIVVYDLNGKCLVHGVNPRLVGKDNSNLQDANGKYSVQERQEIAKAKGKGQQEIAFLNPVTKQIESKLMFFERLGDIIVACGAYKPV